MFTIINEKNIITGEPNIVQNLDLFPFVDRKIFQLDWLPWRYDPVIPMAIITGRGCPFRCYYCINSKIKKSIRYHGPERVVLEILNIIKEYSSLRSIAILDELFILDKDRLSRIVDLIREEKVHKHLMFVCQSRADVLDDEICKLLKDMNVKLITLGFESGVQRILNYLKDNI